MNKVTERIRANIRLNARTNMDIGICGFCGSRVGTPMNFPIGLSHSVSPTASFAAKEVSTHGSYTIEGVSIPLDSGNFLNLQSVAVCSSFDVPLKYEGPIAGDVTGTLASLPDDPNLIQVYTHGVAAPVNSRVANIGAVHYGEYPIYMGKDYTKEEYLEEVKKYFTGKTAIFVFKENDASYKESNEIVQSLIAEMGAEELYSRQINNRNSGTMVNKLVVKVYKFHD